MLRNKKTYIISALLLLLVVCISFRIVTTSKNTNKIKVTLEKCVDGDTAWFMIDGEKKKTRFLYVDTPESTNKIEPYGKEAAEYTCSSLQSADTIYLEYNPSGDKQDKYGRELVWVFVDNDLLQELLAKEGYVKKFYDYNIEYPYKNQIITAHEKAVKNKKGIYSEH